MHSSRNSNGDLLPEHSALQHGAQRARAPRPLPLFLALVREVAIGDPDLARRALEGLRAYEKAPRHGRPPAKREFARILGARLHDHGGNGPPLVLIPSLINPPRILDLDEDVSLANAIARMGRRSFLLDWGNAQERRNLSVGDHVEKLLVPLLESVGDKPALVGYCLGGTMAIAAASLVPVDRLVTLAAPWHFSQYPTSSRKALVDMWSHSKGAAEQLGALPMEVLQAAFWSLDPARTVGKFAQLASREPGSPEARRFVELEEWANDGEPLPYPAAKELIEDLFLSDFPGSEAWKIGGKQVTDLISAPSLHLVAANDRIAPAATAPRGERIAIASGHVGMIVGSSRERLHNLLSTFLEKEF